MLKVVGSRLSTSAVVERKALQVETGRDVPEARVLLSTL